jgi:hypothetical protein
MQDTVSVVVSKGLRRAGWPGVVMVKGRFFFKGGILSPVHQENSRQINMPK